ncbi:MAG: exodeoxyribonuclease VII small subunit [Candidatus Margulisbacteria bacterium]|nr:exodeoxyribonuclease VII small subunit [Candidatus Margulisiibacteriota bacterium]
MAVKKNFESKLDRLEKIVQNLSEEKVDLDEAMKLYQEGMKIGAECLKKIQGAEKDVQQLIEKNGELTVKSFKEEQ